MTNFASKCTLIGENLQRGNAREYRLPNGKTVIVSRADTFDHGDEVMVFPSNGEGEVTDWVELYVARSNWGDDMSDERALNSLENY